MRLWLDCDGVICDSNDAWFRWIRRKLRLDENMFHGPKVSDMTYWEWVRDKFGEEYMEVWRTPGFYTNDVKPYEGVISFVKDYCFKYALPVNFITSSYPGMEDEKTAWIKKHFGIYTNEIIHCWDKAERLTEFDILIEDNKNNAWKHVCRNKGLAIQFNFEKRHPYAEFDPEITSHPSVYYATSYEKILDILRSI